jgi:hypothetical protein
MYLFPSTQLLYRCILYKLSTTCFDLSAIIKYTQSQLTSAANSECAYLMMAERPKHVVDIVFKHPVALIYSSFTHYTSIHNETHLLSPSPSHYMFRPYMAIIRCLYLLKLFPCVVCATSHIICECHISHLK